MKLCASLWQNCGPLPTTNYWRIYDRPSSDDFPTDILATDFRRKIFQQNSNACFWSVFPTEFRRTSITDHGFTDILYPSQICRKLLLPTDFRQKRPSVKPYYVVVKRVMRYEYYFCCSIMAHNTECVCVIVVFWKSLNLHIKQYIIVLMRTCMRYL